MKQSQCCWADAEPLPLPIMSVHWWANSARPAVTEKRSWMAFSPQNFVLPPLCCLFSSGIGMIQEILTLGPSLRCLTACLFPIFSYLRSSNLALLSLFTRQSFCYYSIYLISGYFQNEWSDVHPSVLPMGRAGVGGQWEGFPSLLTCMSTSDRALMWQQCTKVVTTRCADLSGNQLGILYVLVLLAKDLWEGKRSTYSW